MTKNLPHASHVRLKPNHRHNGQARSQLRTGAETMLRDIAFVLKMTQRVRNEIDANQESQEPVLA